VCGAQRSSDDNRPIARPRPVAEAGIAASVSPMSSRLRANATSGGKAGGIAAGGRAADLTY
jgi:hypothetical protein